MSIRYSITAYFNPLYKKKLPALYSEFKSKEFKSNTIPVGATALLVDARKMAYRFYNKPEYCTPAIAVFITDLQLGFTRTLKCERNDGPLPFSLTRSTSPRDVTEFNERTGDVLYVMSDGTSKLKSKAYRGKIPQLVPRYE